MNARNILLLAGASLMLGIAPGTLQAQDDDDDGHIYTVSTHQWPFNNLDEIFEIIEENHELTQQNEFILSQKTLTHLWAGAFSVMFISEYGSFEDIAKAQKRDTELYEAKYPDEEDRDARDEKFAALVGNGMHEDNILQENTKLAK
jgi:hypothetical protein